jgi:hypothetical protein
LVTTLTEAGVEAMVSGNSEAVTMI